MLTDPPEELTLLVTRQLAHRIQDQDEVPTSDAVLVAARELQQAGFELVSSGARPLFYRCYDLSG